MAGAFWVLALFGYTLRIDLASSPPTLEGRARIEATTADPAYIQTDDDFKKTDIFFEDLAKLPGAVGRLQSLSYGIREVEEGDGGQDAVKPLFIADEFSQAISGSDVKEMREHIPGVGGRRMKE